MHQYLPEYEQNAESLSLLSGIEICMEKLWERLRECHAENPKAIKEIVSRVLCRKFNTKRRKQLKRDKKSIETTKLKKTKEKFLTKKVRQL